MSYFLDVFGLIAIGIVLALLSKKWYKKDSFLLYTTSLGILLLFYSVSIGFFCELPFLDIFAEESSCRFMYSSGIFDVPFQNLQELITYPAYLYLGIVMFILYPAFLYIGTQTGYALFGRKPGDKGLLGLI